jgi:hypothetical protein
MYGFLKIIIACSLLAIASNFGFEVMAMAAFAIAGAEWADRHSGNRE